MESISTQDAHRGKCISKIQDTMENEEFGNFEEIKKKINDIEGNNCFIDIIDDIYE